ncbi:hypothetical protein, variant 1 [Aphanomyces invadans]|uniref:MATE efflux family protein n=1 Tax=Aphanomyces invadans TaxID=157072 RepID=A0A024U901_9STRA|nr:hypothetical protein, variant 1 [Aphanomyces invadans]ETW02700.1 hypothetical protein, variant 1 [Aphanomyces invadans]|eukprot:XP_008869305.1 hypothetical protein, variant 1 [Aphanomyces invadans]
MSSTDEKKPLLDAAITINTTASFSDLNNIQDELRQVVALALPVTATFFLEYAPGIITLLLAGHAVDPNDMQTTTLYLDAAAIAIMYMNVTGVTIGLGLATAMDTLCPQAVGGGKSLQTGVYFQAGLVVLGLVFIPIAFANAWATTILVYFGQTYTIAVLAREFATIMLVGLPFMFVYELLKKVLQAQNVVLPMMYCAVIGNCVNAVLGYALTFHTPLGFYGAAVARSVANGVLLLSLVTYIFLNKATFQACWPVAALKEVPKFVALGISGLLMMLFEWWSFELLVFIAGLQTNATTAIGANAILVNVTSCIYMIHFGVGTAAQIRVGNALGAGLSHQAQRTVKCAVILGVSMGMSFAGALLITRKEFPRCFTHDADVISLTSYVAIAIAMYQVADALNTTLQGVLRGAGLQKTGALLNFIAYVVVGLPLGTFLDFVVGWGLLGLWVGMAVGISTSGICGGLIVHLSDWLVLASDAKNRVS